MLSFTDARKKVIRGGYRCMAILLRARSSTLFPMRILDAASGHQAQAQPLAAAYLLNSIVADRDYPPPFDRSTRDGFA